MSQPQRQYVKEVELRYRRLRNLTPHELIFPTLGITIPKSTGATPRVRMETSPAGEAGGVPLVTVRPGQVTDLPEPEDGVLLVVSRVVFEACPSRRDLACPQDLVRDEAGQVVGAKNLAVRG